MPIDDDVTTIDDDAIDITTDAIIDAIAITIDVIPIASSDFFSNSSGKFFIAIIFSDNIPDNFFITYYKFY